MRYTGKLYYISKESFIDFLISVTTQIQPKNTIQMTIFLSFFLSYLRNVDINTCCTYNIRTDDNKLKSIENITEN